MGLIEITTIPPGLVAGFFYAQNSKFPAQPLKIFKLLLRGLRFYNTFINYLFSIYYIKK